jgi:hypothetical protein
MRFRSVIAITTVLLVGLGVKLAFFSASKAAVDLDTTKSVGVSVAQTILPEQKFHDMTFVFSKGD